MGADSVPGSDSPNPCCAEIKKKFAELKEGRNALRKAVKLLQDQMNKLESENKILKEGRDKLEGENRQLKKAYEEERVRGNEEAESRTRESSIRNNLEKEILNLKSEISSYQKSKSPNDVDMEEGNSLRTCIVEKEAEIRRLGELLEKEKERGDCEKKKAEVEKAKAAEAWKLVKAEKSKSEETKRCAEREIKNSEDCRLRLEKIKAEANESREMWTAEITKLKEVNKRVETEKRKGNREKKRADLEKARVEEQRRLNEVERKRWADEKARADNLCQQLEEEKKKTEVLQKKLEGSLSSGSDRCCSCTVKGRHNGSKNAETPIVKLLREQLKLEKKKVKHGKRMAKLEKAEKGFMRKELHILNQDFVKILSRFSMLDGQLSRSIEGTDGLAKVRESSELQGFCSADDLLSLKKRKINSRNDFCLLNTSSVDPLNSERASGGLGLAGGSCTRLASGTDSELDSPIGGSIRKKIRSSSTTLSFSDRKFMGSQGRDAFAISKLVKLAKNTNQRSDFQKPSLEVVKTMQSNDISLVENSTDRGCAKKDPENVVFSSSFHNVVEDTNLVSSHSRKKRKIQATLESLKGLYSEYSQLHLKIGEELSALNDSLNCSQICGMSSCLNDEKGPFTKENRSFCGRKFNLNKNQSVDLRHEIYLQSFNETENQKQTDKITNKCNMALSVLAESTKPQDVRGSVPVGMEEANKDVSSKLDSLVDFENMIQGGDILKLLDLDNDVDEMRYRRAVESPLSPTLPEIEFPYRQLHDGDDSHHLMDKLNRRCEIGEDSSGTLYAFDVIDLEIKSNTLRRRALNTALELISSHCQERDVSHHDTSHGYEYTATCIKSGPSVIERTCGFRGSDNFINNTDIGPSSDKSIGLNRRNEPFVHSPVDSNAVSDSKTLDGVVSMDVILQSESERSNSAKYILHTKPLHEGIVKFCSVGAVDMERSISPHTHRPSDKLEYIQDSSDCVFGNQIDGNGKGNDSSVNARSINNEMLCNQSPVNIGSTTMMGASVKRPSSTVLEMEDPCRGNGILELERVANYCVVFSETKDEDSILRVARSRHAFVNQKFILCQVESMASAVIHSLALQQDLQPKEKASVFFSLLMYNISVKMPAESKCCMATGYEQFLISFSAQINRVISNEETSWFFRDICQRDILISLIEDFLIERKVLIYLDGLDEISLPTFSSCNYQRLGMENLYVSFGAATMGQFVSGCIIFASMCAAIDEIGFLLESSFKILRRCQSGTSWILSMLHVFASICGKRFFDLDSYRFLITVIRSMVLFIEGGQKSNFSLSPLKSACDAGFSFPPCEHCPFATDAICMDRLIDLLLDWLHNNALNEIQFPVTCKTDAMYGMIPSCISRNKESHDYESEPPGWNIDCNSSCSIFSCRTVSSALSNCFSGKTLCYFTDIASLVELIGCYMSWEWIYSRIIFKLLKSLEFCLSDEFSAALFVLIGQLARFGIDAGGYQQTGISDLGYTLSVLFDANIVGKRSLPTQFAAVGAMLHFLPLEFEETVAEYQELTCDTNQAGLVKSLRKWFSQLSKEQQSLSLGLFRYVNV